MYSVLEKKRKRKIVLHPVSTFTLFESKLKLYVLFPYLKPSTFTE